MKRAFFVGVTSGLAVVFGATAVLAVDQTSTNYQNLDSSAIPTQFVQTSANYSVNAAVEPIVGKSTSANYSNEHGSPLKEGFVVVPPPPPPPPPGGGGGGGGGGGPVVVPSGEGATALTLEYKSPTFLRTQKITGKRDGSTARVLVNGSDIGVILLSNLWTRVMPLFLGINSIAVQGMSGNGASTALRGSIQRLLIGDSNSDGHVDDLDLSLVVRGWGTGKPMDDFTEDGTVDDLDLSLLIAYWGVTY